MHGKNCFGRLLLGISVVGACAASANAAVTLVDWGGDYVSTNISIPAAPAAVFGDYDGGGTSNDSRITRVFDDTTTAYSPAASYNAPVGKSGRFYGGAQATWYNTAAAVTFNPNQIGQSGSVDRIQIGVGAGAVGTTSAINLAIAFLQTDFLNSGGSLGTFADYTLSLHTASVGAVVPVVRFLIKDGSQYYVSFLSINTGFSTLSGTANGTTWAAYSPGTNLNFDQSQSFAAHTFTDVKALGIYMEADSTASNQAALVRIDSITITGVPEPTSLSLLALGAAGLLLRRRKA
jgi:hypothetical protein